MKLRPLVAADVVQPVVEVPAYRIAVAGFECQPFTGGANHLDGRLDLPRLA